MSLEVSTVADFVTRTTEIKEKWFNRDDPWGPWFRGQRCSRWDLRPKLYRDYGGQDEIRGKNVENEACEEFRIRAPALSDSPLPDNAWDWYFLMQHFGAPTRLLDWTEGSLIALYFAVKDNNGSEDAAVWALDPYELNKEVIEREEVLPPGDIGLSKDDQERLNQWLPKNFDPFNPKSPVAVYPSHKLRRISTQRSCFTVHGQDFDGLEPFGQCLEKIVIQGSSVLDIRRDLETCGIDETTIYPDLDGLGRTICSRWKNRC